MRFDAAAAVAVAAVSTVGPGVVMGGGEEDVMIGVPVGVGCAWGAKLICGSRAG